MFLQYFNTLHTSTNVIYITGLLLVMDLSCSVVLVLSLQSECWILQEISNAAATRQRTSANSSSRLNQRDSFSEWETVIMHLCSMTCVVQYWCWLSLCNSFVFLSMLTWIGASQFVLPFEKINVAQGRNWKKEKNFTNSCHELWLPGRQRSVAYQCRGIRQIHVVIFL